MRIKGLDTLRFICAFIVLVGHCGIPKVYNNITDYIVYKFTSLCFEGAPAVIIFFIISGFCIHYSRLQSKNFSLANYYLSRYIRILLPMYVAILIARIFGYEYSLFNTAVLWSLICELIYYTIYPIVLNIAKIFGWKKTVIFFYVVSFITSYSFFPNKMSLNEYPHEPNWLIGLPVWLIGCLLAEDVFKKQSSYLTSRKIFCIRLTVLIQSVFCLILLYYANVSLLISLNLFSLLGYYWIKNEIYYWQSRNEIKVLEFFGSWSYSLYLLHPILINAWKEFVLYPTFFEWIIFITTTLYLSFVFYLLVELPSHKFAQRLKKQSS